MHNITVNCKLTKGGLNIMFEEEKKKEPSPPPPPPPPPIRPVKGKVDEPKAPVPKYKK